MQIRVIQLPTDKRYLIANDGSIFGPKVKVKTFFTNKQRPYAKFSCGQKQMKVSVAVALAFLGPRPEGCEVDHIDENRLNDRLDNLQYLTSDQNIQKHYRLKREAARKLA